MKGKIILVRHGESESNVSKDILKTVPNHKVPLTDRGRRQALSTGMELRKNGITDAHFIISTHLRTVETAKGIQQSVGVISEKFTPLIREIDIGNLIPDASVVGRERSIIGNYHYRFPNGESGGDLVDRVQRFLDTRPFDYGDCIPIVVVTHAMTIRAFQMALENLTPDEFDALHKPRNCEMFEIQDDETKIVQFGEM